ncbi:MAG: hypothetical protein AAFU03_07830, partial [Bacteroidota bacterium]
AAFQWVGGFSLTVFDRRIGLYAPVAGSNDLWNILEQQGGFFDRLSLQLNFERLWPWHWMN